MISIIFNLKKYIEEMSVIYSILFHHIQKYSFIFQLGENTNKRHPINKVRSKDK